MAENSRLPKAVQAVIIAKSRVNARLLPPTTIDVLLIILDVLLIALYGLFIILTLCVPPPVSCHPVSSLQSQPLFINSG